MRILTFSNLYPNSVQPRHGIFVEQRLQQLLRQGDLQATVCAPVPWFPSRSKRFGKWAEFAAIPSKEKRSGVEVFHPRYPVIPKIGMSVSPLLMATAVRSCVKKIIASGFEFDLIDAHYFYPDGVAAVFLARWLGKPVIISARGSDINVLPEFALPRRWIRWAAQRCDAITTVSQELKDRLANIGAFAAKTTVLRNGVDLELFRPQDRQAIRQELGVAGLLLLSVGNLIEQKGHHLVIEAIARRANDTLIVIGNGPAERSLRALASSLGVSNRVRFINNVAQPDLARYYNAADVLILASLSEGMPNVVLESLACGTPVIATATGGATELITCPEAGMLLAERKASAIVTALESLHGRDIDRAATRRYAESLDWADVIRQQSALYSAVVAGHDAGGAR